MNSTKNGLDYKNQAATGVDKLLNKNEIVEFKKGLNLLREVYFDITGLGDEVRDLNDEFTELESGVAVSPHTAIACLEEIMRSARFIRGVTKAINHALNIFPHQKIHLVYAGSGPFAPLVIPILHLFSKEQLKVTFIDIHERSIKLLKLILDQLELNDYVNGILRVDATKHQHPKEDPIHIVVTETMQTGLKKEPQFAVTLNYANQLVENGILIPNNINVSLQYDQQMLVKNQDGETLSKKGNDIYLGSIFDLNLEAAKKINANNNLYNKFGENIIHAREVKIPNNLERRNRFKICTEINVFDNETLTKSQCSLTIPYTLHIPGIDIFGQTLKFHYAIGKFPEFRYSIAKKGIFDNLTKIFQKAAK